jgi:prefoldin subunit 5
MSGELDEIGYQLKELNKNISELNEKLGMLEELGELTNIDSSINKLLDIQKEYMDIQKGIIVGDGSG